MGRNVILRVKFDQFVINDNFRTALTTEELFRNFKKYKDVTRISVKFRDVFKNFPCNISEKSYKSSS